jgi:hypothetical protein
MHHGMVFFLYFIVLLFLHLILLHAPRDGLLEADGLERLPVYQRLEPVYVCMYVCMYVCIYVYYKYIAS